MSAHPVVHPGVPQRLVLSMTRGDKMRVISLRDRLGLKSLGEVVRVAVGRLEADIDGDPHDRR